ncbi:sodium-dependent transporter [Edaphobacillus lindanitolerans]|uniref:Neurotransmitter:Na+ symporter, NSS family n=1 Tax=Edaphobacillus lindanitolerans TaxID=550447 RepID=A0A1U7PN92_9BACI|nr:sodium-dependent transporter [Edaphobacillus lindanitolerans]SIT92096.1 neurotransmitter:Na+ symporter, NSS family [Edaphobacillus lindanitolerans]
MTNRDQWTSKLGFILAAAGSAIGLGAIWKFPYMAGMNGGSVFIFLFIISTILIGLPVLIAEFIIGRRGQADAVTAMRKLAPGTAWPIVGKLGFVLSIIILSFYSVVGGWILSYLVRSSVFLAGGGMPDDFGMLFDQVIADPKEAVLAQAVFMLLTVLIVSGGVKGGIERASKWMMPLLFVSFIILAVRSLTLPGAMEGIRFMFVPDFSYLNGHTALLALGQAFFSLSVGIGGMITYASYLPKDENLTKSAWSVTGLNILISILAGLVIFPAVFALGGSPADGPGLIFVVLPAIFTNIPFGGWFMLLFFVLMLFATLTSSISMLEITVSIGIRNKYDRRKRAAWVYGLIIFIVGIPSALSFGLMADVKLFGLSMFDLADTIVSKFGMPIGAFLISLFAGFVLSKTVTDEELGGPSAASAAWRLLVRWFCPAAILVIFVSTLAG